MRPERYPGKAKEFTRILLVGLLILVAIPGRAEKAERPTLPDVSYPDLSGKSHSLKEWQGQVVVLNFWASWCSPCLSEIRHLVEYQKTYKHQGIQVIGMGVDDARHLKNVQRSLQINYPVLVAGAEAGRSLLHAWGNETGMIPYTVVFGKDGRVVGAHRGVFDDQALEELVLPLLGSE
ncbi:MAG: TlpA disulfide reductase family protein [Candidatus Thiodiazotropha sp.]|jgi:peroxiredoxin